MKGSYHVLIRNRKLVYEFTIQRNITVIRDDSATGKTTLVEMIASFEREGRSSGIELQCAVPCRVLNNGIWERQMWGVHNSLVFIDECNAFIKTETFARLVQASDNYFILITRDDLANLPYSVEEVYGIRTSEHYAGLKRAYHEFYRIYSGYPRQTQRLEGIIVEDANAGFAFWDFLYP